MNDKGLHSFASEASGRNWPEHVTRYVSKNEIRLSFKNLQH